MSDLETKNRTLAVNLNQKEADFKQKLASVEVRACALLAAPSLPAGRKCGRARAECPAAQRAAAWPASIHEPSSHRPPAHPPTRPHLNPGGPHEGKAGGRG